MVNHAFTVSIGGGHAVDLSPLRGVRNFVGLNISSGDLQNLNALKGLSSLQTLAVNHVHIHDLSPLSELRHLRELALQGDVDLTDLTPTATLPELIRLQLNATPIRDISPLRGTHSLKRLDLTGSRITDITPLIGIGSLQELYIDSTQLAKRLIGLGIKKLVVIDLYGAIDTTSIGDIASLEQLQISSSVNVNLSHYDTFQNLGI